MLAKLITIFLCSFLVAACSEPDETSGSDPINTSEIGLIINASVRSDGTSFVNVYMTLGGGTHNDLRLGGGDQLILMLDDTQMPLEELFVPGNLMFPENHYYYQLDINENISSRNPRIVFARPSAQDASSAIVFGVPPNIISPTPGAVFSNSSEDIVVTFQADTIEPFALALREPPCSRTLFDSNKWTTALTLPAATTTCHPDEVELKVSRGWRTAPGPTLNQELSSTVSGISRSATVQYIP